MSMAKDDTALRDFVDVWSFDDVIDRPWSIEGAIGTSVAAPIVGKAEENVGALLRSRGTDGKSYGKEEEKSARHGSETRARVEQGERNGPAFLSTQAPQIHHRNGHQPDR